MKIFKMIEEDIIPSASIQSIAITGSQVTVQTGTTNLAAVSSMIVTLQSDKRNQYVTVTTTSDATSSSTDAVIATFEITYAVGGTN
jgi:sialic acid synthase SpsE